MNEKPAKPSLTTETYSYRGFSISITRDKTTGLVIEVDLFEGNTHLGAFSSTDEAERTVDRRIDPPSRRMRL